MTKIFKRIIEPHSALGNIEERGRVQVYIVYILVQILATVSALILLLFKPELLTSKNAIEPLKHVIFFLGAAYLLLYTLVKIGYVKTSVALYVLVMCCTLIYTNISINDAVTTANSISWFGATVLVASLILSLKQTYFVILSCLLSYSIILSHFSMVQFKAIAVGHLIYFLCASAMIVVGTHQREKIEKTLTEERAASASTSRLTSLGEMAGSIAHEINTPLAVISMQSQMLLHRAEINPQILPSEILNKIQVIYNTTDRISKIIKTMRSFSRDGSKDEFIVTSLDSCLESTLDLCQESCRKHHINLKINNQEKNLYFKGREIQVSQVLLNLMKNSIDAVKHKNEKWIKIDIRGDHKSIFLTLMDSGNGIPRTVAENMFNPFFTTKGIGQGTGLGLSISRSIIENHGGQLTYEANEKNTCFKMTLPQFIEENVRGA